MSTVTSTQETALNPEAAMAAPHPRTPRAHSAGSHGAGSHGPAAHEADRAGGAASLSDRSIADMRGEIDDIDAELVRLIQRRSEISHAIGAARASEGGTRIVYSREMKILDRFAVLGPAGTELGMLLLSLGRGQLGRK